MTTAETTLDPLVGLDYKYGGYRNQSRICSFKVLRVVSSPNQPSSQVGAGLAGGRPGGCALILARDQL
jgi:hypothetical protein